MELREIMGALMSAAEKVASDLDELIGDVKSDEPEAAEKYSEQLTETEAALEAARAWLANPENGKPVRVVVDFSGGLFNDASSNVPVEVLAFDTDDERNLRAHIPIICDNHIWSSIHDGDVDPDYVNAVYDGAVWLDDPEDEEACSDA